VTGVLHRDVKPANVYVANDARGQEVVKLFDFGIAGIRPDAAIKDQKVLTAPGTIVGTPEYMPPEQLFGQPLDPRSDVYAAGVTLFECLTGDVSFPGDYNTMLLAYSRGEGCPSLRAKREDVPAGLAAAIERAAHPDPNKRFPNAMAFAHALDDALGAPLKQTGLLGLNEAPEPTAAAATIPSTLSVDPDSSGPVLLLKRRTPAIALQRRRAPRAPYVTPSHVFRADGTTVDSRLEEISETGVLLIAYSTLTVNEPVRLRFALPASGRVTLVDAVCRWSRLARGRYAMGLEFRGASLELKADVVAYASALSSRPQ
jgi:serine/threonine protein kinase